MITGDNLQKMNISAVIVSAGLSSRMGKFKPLLKIGEDSFIKTVIKNFYNAGVNDFVIVTGKNSDLIERELNENITFDGFKYKCVHNKDYESTDMFHSVKMGLKCIRSETDACFITTVDIPLFSPYSVKKLIEKMQENSYSVIKPHYKKISGHPVIIKSDIISELLKYDADNGLKGALDKFSSVYNITLPDPGLIKDADTQEDYENIIIHFENKSIPDYEQCIEIYKFVNLPENIIKHCEAVSNIALKLAEKLIVKKYDINPKLVKAAALLHDIKRGEKDHEQIGAKLLMDMGFKEVSEIVLEHMELAEYKVKNPIEKYIVYLADKLVMEDRLVTIKERYSEKLNNANNDMKDKIINKMNNTLIIYEQFNKMLGEELLYEKS